MPNCMTASMTSSRRPTGRRWCWCRHHFSCWPSVIQQICKDARMREAAHEIRTEVGHLMGDLERLRERVLKLQQHFDQANDDVAQVLISADKLTKRGGRIEALEFGDGDEAPRDARVIPAPIGRKIDAAE